METLFHLLNMYLAYLTHIVRSENDLIERCGGVLQFVKKLELSSESFGRYCKNLLNQVLFYIFQAIQL